MIDDDSDKRGAGRNPGLIHMVHLIHPFNGIHQPIMAMLLELLDVKTNGRLRFRTVCTKVLSHKMMPHPVVTIEDPAVRHETPYLGRSGEDVYVDRTLGKLEIKDNEIMLALCDGMDVLRRLHRSHYHLCFDLNDPANDFEKMAQLTATILLKELEPL